MLGSTKLWTEIRTDGLTDKRTENRTYISHLAKAGATKIKRMRYRTAINHLSRASEPVSEMIDNIY